MSKPGTVVVEHEGDVVEMTRDNATVLLTFGLIVPADADDPNGYRFHPAPTVTMADIRERVVPPSRIFRQEDLPGFLQHLSVTAQYRPITDDDLRRVAIHFKKDGKTDQEIATLLNHPLAEVSRWLK